MAEVIEPPPFDNDDDDVKDEDDLFSDAKEKPSSPESEQSQESGINLSDSKSISKDENSADDETDNRDDETDNRDDETDNREDFFEGVGAEIKLDSDEEDGQGKDENENNDSDPPATGAAAQGLKPQISVTETAGPKTKLAAPSLKADDVSELTDEQHDLLTQVSELTDGQEAYETQIKVTETLKMGEGMSAYIVYKVITKTTNPAFRRPESAVLRRFSDFLGLHAKLTERHLPLGVIVPPAPEKSVLGMTKVKMSKEDSGSADFIERRRAALERYLIRTAMHPTLVSDPDFKEFLEKDGDLPKSTSTSALSGAGVKRLFSKVGESFDKITLKVEESDEWFEEKQQQVEALFLQLRKLHASLEILSQHRRELSVCAASFARSAAMLGNVEEHTALSRALSQLAETEEKIETIHKEQTDADFFLMAELMKDYVALMAAVKDVFYERVKTYKTWKDAEATLGKKRDNKAKLELQNKMDKISLAQAEVTEWEQKVEKCQEDFEKISRNIRKEMARFEKLRVTDFKDGVVKYLEVLLDSQQKLIKYWETFLPEAKAIA